MTNDDSYVRGWRDGYAAGRDDEANNEPVREPPRQRQQPASPRDRQIKQPGRNR